MKTITWKRTAGRIYVSEDNKFMVKNVGPKCWGVFINDGDASWDLNWVGSTYMSLKDAQDAAFYFSQK